MPAADPVYHRGIDYPLGTQHEDGTWRVCEPPETFTFGGMLAHVITFNAYRRMVAIDVLRSLGVKVEGVGCPMEYLESLARAETRE
jgi:hypothetical protein